MQSRKLLSLVLTTALFFGTTSIAFAAETWPAPESTQIAEAGDELPSGYEPSGAVWHDGLKKLVIVGDDGDVSTMDANGSNVTTWTPGGDLEGITLKDSNSSLVYLANESNAKILEFDLETGTLTGTEWSLKAYLGGDSYSTGMGIEALTYANGDFFVGLQSSGDIYQFTLGENESVTYIAKTNSPLGYTDISGLNYKNNTFYALYDSAGKMLTLDSSGILTEYELAGETQEGIAINDETFFIAQDNGKVWSYTTVTEEEVIVEEEPEPEIEEEPETELDYRTVESWDTNGDTLEVTYVGGTLQEIKIREDLRTKIFTIHSDTKLIVLNGRMLMIFENGEMIYHRRLGR